MKNLRFSLRYALVILAMLGLGFLVMEMNGRLYDLRQNTLLKERVAVEATDLMNTQNALRTQIAYATSDAAVEVWAREDGHMVRSGDNPVIPLMPAGATPVATPVPVVTKEPVENWEIWMWLFFDTR